MNFFFYRVKDVGQTMASKYREIFHRLDDIDVEGKGVEIKREIIDHTETVEFRHEANDFSVKTYWLYTPGVKSCQNDVTSEITFVVMRHGVNLYLLNHCWGKGGVHQCASTASFIITTFIEEQFKEQWG